MCVYVRCIEEHIIKLVSLKIRLNVSTNKKMIKYFLVKMMRVKRREKIGFKSYSTLFKVVYENTV